MVLVAAWLDLGLVGYRWALQIQENLLARRLAGSLGPVVIVQRNYPVVTLGRQASLANVLVDPFHLSALGVEVVEVQRGGDVTFHDPGQLVVSPLLNLREIGMDAHRYMWSVEEAIIRLLASFGLEASRKDGYPGVWIGDRKIASVGFALRRWVTFHGFSINVSADLSGFELVRPCGLDGRPMTSLELEISGPVSFDEVKRRLRGELGSVFALEFTDVQTNYLPNEEVKVGADRGQG